MTTSDPQKMLHEDPDYVALKRFGFSVAKLVERYPNGCPDHVVAQALAVTEDEVRAEYERIVLKLRELMS